MKTRVVWAIVFCLPLVLGCQRLFVQEEDPGTQELNYVSDAQGNLYDIGCLRGLEKNVAREAASSCIRANISQPVSPEEAKGVRGAYNYSYWYWWYIDPRYVWNNNYDYNCSYNNNYNCSYNNNYGYNWDFCSYIFGYSYTNCYSDFFGYDQYDYSYYTSDCSYCLYKKNSSKCYDKCWRRAQRDWCTLGWNGWCY